MKRSISLAAVVLLLVATLWCDSEARMYPYGQGDPSYYDGDDHTWGGESQLYNPEPLMSPGQGTGPVVTGFAPVDLFINTIVLEWLIEDIYSKSQVTNSTYQIIHINQQNEGTEGTVDNDSDFRGN
ncbi:MAG: hypothetical protein AB1744_05395 [Candidatus Zixiibacteriota bacterium]